MILHVLFGQRICAYPGQYAPEALAVIDEYVNDENPDYIIQQKEKYSRGSKGKDFSSLEILEIEISTSKIDKILNPKNKIKGKIE